MSCKNTTFYEEKSKEVLSNAVGSLQRYCGSRSSVIFKHGVFGGDRIHVSSTVRWRVGEAFNTEPHWSRNDIDLPNSSFVTNLVHTRLSYSFTPRIFVQGLLQYNDVDDLWSINLRFGWLQSPNTGLFIVYNELREFDEVLATEINRSVIMKYSQLFDLLD